MTKLLLCILVLTACCACTLPYDDEALLELARRREEERQACLNAGGVPIRENWDGGMSECQFPPSPILCKELEDSVEKER